MTSRRAHWDIIEFGDRRGLGSVYTESGNLIRRRDEEILRSVSNWDVDVISPWRRVMPHILFPGFHGEARSTLYVTSQRIVIIREIDEWRELAGELTPLGLPNAAAKEKRLKALKTVGARQFCQIAPQALAIVSRRRFVKHRCMLDLKLVGDDGRRYGIMVWKTDGRDEGTLGLIESRFRQKTNVKNPVPKS